MKESRRAFAGVAPANETVFVLWWGSAALVILVWIGTLVWALGTLTERIEAMREDQHRMERQVERINDRLDWYMRGDAGRCWAPSERIGESLGLS